MDFVTWCDFVLKKTIEATQASSDARSIGADQYQLARSIFGQTAMQPEFHGSKRHEAMHDALRSLQDIFLIESSSTSLWKATKLGKDLSGGNDMTLLWQEICQEKLDQEHQQLLSVVNKLSPHDGGDHIYLEELDDKTLLTELGWSEGFDLLWPVARELEEIHLISCRASLGRHLQCYSTYRGFAWEMRRGFTLESRFIDDLVAEWETTSVDFKRQLSLDTMDQKAEFVKDILSLVNTKASGRRWLIIGFHDTTHQYFGPPDAKITQNRIEQILARYIEPSVEVHYETVDCRVGRVGKLEVIRDSKKLPYHVKEQMNRERKPPLMSGDLFVRHGSQVEKPTEAELLALQEEGNHAISTVS